MESNNSGLKFTIIFVFAVSIAGLIATGFMYQILNTDRREIGALQDEKAALHSKLDTLNTENEQLRQDNTRMSEQLKTFASEKDQWKKEMDEVQKKAADIQAKFKTLESAAPKAEAVAIPNTANPSPLNVAAVIPTGGSAAQPAGANTGAPIVTAQAQGAAPAEQAPAAKTFQVMTVNRKFNFVVVNVGLQDQFKMGDKLAVERGGKKAGTVQIEKAYDNFSAAAITEEAKDSPIQPGDSIKKI